MRWYDFIGWAGTIGVLATYLRWRKHFDLANACLWPAVILPSVCRGAWSAAAITFAFGQIGTWHVYATKTQRHRDPCPGPACYGEGDVCYLHTYFEDIDG